MQAVAEIKTGTPYNDPERTRVFNYLKKHPGGNKAHFYTGGYPRATEVPEPVFWEVYSDLKREGELLKTKSEILAQKAARPAESKPTNDIITNTEAQSAKETQNMAKELKISELSATQRDLFINMAKKNNDVSQKEIEDALGAKLIKAHFYQFRFQAKNGKAKLSDDPKARHNGGHPNGTAKTTAARNVPVITNGGVVHHSPFVYTGKLPSPIELGKPVDANDYSVETIKALQDFLPSFLSEILDKRMQYKVLVVEESDGSAVTKQIKVKRVV